jgi:hypothetical protein
VTVREVPGTCCNQLKRETITFENGNRAIVITAPRDASAQAILDALQIAPPRAVILLFGGTAGIDDSCKAHLKTLFCDGIIPVAAELKAVIIDRGIESGLISMIGEAAARFRGPCQLLGIAPADKVSYPGQSKADYGEGALLESNHSHFVLVEGYEWGSETRKMLELACAFDAPIVAIPINGGAIAAHAVLQSVRTGSQLFVVEGTGRFADELGAAIRDRQSAKSATVSEIVGSACTVLFRVDGPAEKLRTELRRMLCD